MYTTAAAFANLLEQFVAANLVTGFFRERKVEQAGSLEFEIRGRCFEEILSFLVRLEQCFDLLAQRSVTRTGLVQIGGAFLRP